VTVVTFPFRREDRHHDRVHPGTVVAQCVAQDALRDEAGLLIDAAGARVEREYLQ
jgi:hypothetical protein